MIRNRLFARDVSRNLRSAVGRTSLSALALSCLAISGAAQTPRLIVSTTSDPGGGPGGWEDGDLLAVGGGGVPRAFFTGCHWTATGGFAPSDVDGFTFLPGTRPGDMGSMAFSILSDIGGYLDGDVLGFATGGGVLVLTTEASLVAGLGLPMANVDLDGIAYDDQGQLLFSLKSDLAATAIGDVKDGDLLRLNGSGGVELLLPESAVNASFQAATGLSSNIGDVLGIEWVAGEPWVAIQSPSSFDGAVLACGTVPRIVADENSIGLGGAELNALSLMHPEADLPGIDVSPKNLAPGETFDAWFHGPPNSSHLVLMSGGVGWNNFAHAPGFAVWCFDPTDPWLLSFFTAPSAPIVNLDSNGEYRTRYTLPTAPVYGPGWLGRDGWSFQMVDLATLELSAPVRLLKL